MDTYKALLTCALLWIVTGALSDVLDDYTKTDGVGVLAVVNHTYAVHTAAECAVKCNTELAFRCRAFIFVEKDEECVTVPSNSKIEMQQKMSSAFYEKKEECMHCIGEDYRGNVSKTESGYTCQRWNTQTPHKHGYLPSALPHKYLEENYCRNPDGKPRPWCFTTDPKERWDFCNIPRCASEPPTIVPELTCTTGDGIDYRGTISVTVSGKACQLWSAQFPHKHSQTPENYPCKGLEGNYCRNPDDDIQPWCYTTDPDTRWEYCKVPICGDKPGPEICGKSRVGRPYCHFSKMTHKCVAKAHAWPWHISLRNSSGTHFCGGTLIDAQWVLTAASCLVSSKQPSAYRVYLGIHRERATEASKQVRDVEKMILEPTGKDIALLKLSNPAILNDEVLPACLPQKDYVIPSGATCYATGWTGEDYTTVLSEERVLNEMVFPVLGNKMCQKRLNMSEIDHEICVGYIDAGINSCEGDNGGPFVCLAQKTFVIQGVISRLGCNDAVQLAVYPRVAKFVDWITNEMKENT